MTKQPIQNRFSGQALLFFLCASVALADGSPVFHTNTVVIPGTPKPDYLETYVDPVFKTMITRITGDPGTDIQNVKGKWNKIARHGYSKRAAWNCDQSMLLLAKHHGYPSYLFLDGTTYAPLFGRNSVPGAETRWHPKMPDIMVYVKNNVIGYWNVRKDKAWPVASFEGYSELQIGLGEGNLSLDGTMIVVDGRKGRDRIAFAYDLESKRKYPDLVLNNVEWIDWISISASGRYIVLHGKIDGNNHRNGGDQTQVYALDGNKVGKLWHAYGRPSHYDLTIDENGDDIAVGGSKSKPDDGRVIKRRLRDGKVTVLTPGGYAGHTSTRNLKRLGWAYVTYQHRGPSWAPYWDEVVAVKLDGSLTVERIAHLHTKMIDYLTEAHAVPSPDGNRVLWASSWGAISGRPIGAYIVQRARSGEKPAIHSKTDSLDRE